MIKKLMISKLFNLILSFFAIFIISFSIYSYASSKTNIGILEYMLNLIKGDISASYFNTMSASTSALSSLIMFQIVSFLSLNLSLIFLVGFLFRLYSVEERDSLKDNLTKIYNRKAILFGLKKELVRARRYGHDLSIAMVDIDHFKNYNDSMGHVAGDKVLFKIANILGRNIRESDSIGRIGGEEFLIIFPETDLHSASKICESLRDKIENTPFLGENKSLNKKITISIGLSKLRKGGFSIDTQNFIEKADKKLFEAKHAGRNIVAI